MGFAKWICLSILAVGAILLVSFIDVKVRAEDSFWGQAILSVADGGKYSPQPDWMNDDIAANRAD